MSTDPSKILIPFEVACQRLNLPANATQEQIQSTYKKLSIKYHPDKQGGDATKFNELTQARDSMLARVNEGDPKMALQELLKAIDEKIEDGTAEQRNNLQALGRQAFDLINNESPDKAELKKVHNQINNIFLAIKKQNKELRAQNESILNNWIKEAEAEYDAWIKEKQLLRPDIECGNKAKEIGDKVIRLIKDDKTLHSSTPEELKEYLYSRMHEVKDELNKWWFSKGYEPNYEEKYSSNEQSSEQSTPNPEDPEHPENKKQNERKKQDEEEKQKQEEMRFEQENKDNEDAKKEEEERFKQANSAQFDSQSQYESSSFKSTASKTKHKSIVIENLYKALSAAANNDRINSFCTKNNYEFIHDAKNNRIIFQSEDKESEITVEGRHVRYRAPLDGNIDKHRIAMIDVYMTSVNPTLNSNHELTCSNEEGLKVLERLLAQQLRARKIAGTINGKSIEQVLDENFEKSYTPHQGQAREAEPEYADHNKMGM